MVAWTKSALTVSILGAYREFAEGVDVLTVEIEHIDADALDTVAAELGLDVEPTPSTLRLIQVLQSLQSRWAFHNPASESQEHI